MANIDVNINAMQEMNSIKLSLCIPTYNRPEEFKRMLSGVLPQLTDNVEVIVRDDSVTLETKNIFDQLIGGKGINYQYHIGDKIGLDAASLFLFEHARGEFIWLFSDDDEMLDGGVDKVLALIDADPDLNAIWANFDSDLPSGLAVKNRESGYFQSGSQVLEVASTGIGLVSTQIFRRKLGLLGFDIAKKHIVGFSFASTAIYISVLAGPGNFYFMNGPYVLCHPTKNDEIISATNSSGEIINNGFHVYGIEFHNIVREFDGNFDRKSVRKLLSDNFGALWRGMVVGYAGGWDTPRNKRLKMFQIYWSYPEFWLALPLLCLPKGIVKVLYRIYKMFFTLRKFDLGKKIRFGLGVSAKKNQI
jgi:glycosyltransferase involved in cell wall biosynthesis